jgi:dipeptidyl aminopeptidase/acylaminoacyl peptidase
MERCDLTDQASWKQRFRVTQIFSAIVHGGPSTVFTHTFSPLAQTWLDHGFAWISVNYRGSTTFGKAFQRAIWGQLGQLERQTTGKGFAGLGGQGRELWG